MDINNINKNGMAQTHNKIKIASKKKNEISSKEQEIQAKINTYSKIELFAKDGKIDENERKELGLHKTYDLNNEQDKAEFEKIKTQIRKTHVNLLQKMYESKLEIGSSESIEEYQTRLEQEYSIRQQKNDINQILDKPIEKSEQNFGL